MIETLLLITAMFIAFYAIFHLITAIVTGKKDIRDLYWFWIILCIPVAGAILYFSINATYKSISATKKQPRVTP